MIRAETLLATVDERQARLFRCFPTQRETWRLVEEEGLPNAWEWYHERGRPAMLGRGPATVPPHEAAEGHAEEEARRRFAGDVADWLEKRTPPEGGLIVFVASRFMNPVRERLSGSDLAWIRLREGELTRLLPHELAEHPAVAEALTGARSSGPSMG